MQHISRSINYWSINCSTICITVGTHVKRTTIINFPRYGAYQKTGNFSLEIYWHSSLSTDEQKCIYISCTLLYNCYFKFYVKHPVVLWRTI